MKKLYIDDLRRPPDLSWDLVKTNSEAMTYIMENGCPDVISFDYCLSGGQTIRPFVLWLIDEDKQQKGAFIPSAFRFEVHSSSVIGENWIKKTLSQYLSNRFKRL